MPLAAGLLQHVGGALQRLYEETRAMDLLDLDGWVRMEDTQVVVRAKLMANRLPNGQESQVQDPRIRYDGNTRCQLNCVGKVQERDGR